MPIYSINNNSLKLVTQKKFNLEENIQKLTEQNLENIFGLKFVSGATNNEFSVRAQEQDFYIDTLAFDEVQKSFVIIEYKKDKSISVIDQGFAYLSAMLNHKADFILEINERLNRNLKKKDIKWEQSRVIFVSPEFTNYQLNAVNFKDLPIFLYEVNIYDNNLIEYKPIKPYRTTESIGSLSKDKIIKEVSKEVKVYSEEDFLKNENTSRLYISLKEKLLEFNPELNFNPTKNYIGVQKTGNWRMIAYINFQSNRLLIDLSRSEPNDYIDPKKKIYYKPNSKINFNQHISTFTVESEEDVDYALNILKQAYKRFIELHINS